MVPAADELKQATPPEPTSAIADNDIPADRIEAVDGDQASQGPLSASLLVAGMGDTGAWVAGAGLALFLVYRTQKRIRQEWQDRYAPFGALTELNNMLDLEQPSLQGALQVLWASFGKSNRDREIAFKAPLVLGHQLDQKSIDAAAETARALLGQHGKDTIVHDKNPNEFLRDPEINRFGAKLARQGIELIRQEITKSESDLSKEIADYKKSSDVELSKLVLITIMAKYARDLAELTETIVQGFHVMGAKHARYAYYSSTYASAFRELPGLVTDRDFISMVQEAKERRPEDEVYLYGRKLFSRFRQGLDYVEKTVALLESGRLGH